ncbi:MAG TPA: serine/threonine-protein kinase, partial [Gemmatimonadaceae bacterium]|nr:serine/threonine-protein kinase [Gemmatimonadaceae bacterium]
MSADLPRLTAALADRYRVERELGSGGMATVYLAEDLKHHRQVAIKVLRPELAAALGPERFVREIEIAARLQHPHILPVHDSGQVDGILYYVMPYVDGESLRERLTRQGELPIPDAVRLLAEIADALSHAHSRGVVHRDIKPENVMLSGRHALVMDFGVAKAVSEASGRNTLTTAGVALGTPAYMAPEQASADPHLDHRVDIYALGVVGYELLAGRPPFAGASPQQVLAAHVTQTPEPVGTHRPTLAPALANVIMTALAKRPADRWQSADEMLAQLEPLTTTSGGATPAETRPFAAVGGIRPSRRAAWAIGSLAVLLVAWGIFAVARRGSGGQLAVGTTRTITLDAGLYLDPALSPDGKMLAYAAGPPTRTHLFVRSVDGARAIPLTDSMP